MSTERLNFYQNTEVVNPFLINGDDMEVVDSLLPTGITIENIETVNHFPDLEGILDAIHRERGTLLQPQLDALEDSFADRRAVVLMDREKTIGYVRLSPLLDKSGKARLGIPEDFPDIAETGTAIIHPDYRGHGYYPKLRTKLQSMFVEEMKEERLLVLGTTKNLRVIESLDDAIEIGLQFTIVSRDEIPMIAPFTCVCEGDFGNGFQNGESCPKAATSNELIQIEKHRWSEVKINGGSKIPCTIYVSDIDLAKKMESKLIDQFGSQNAVVSALKTIGYYE